MLFRKIDSLLDTLIFKLRRYRHKKISVDATIELPISLNYFDNIKVSKNSYIGPGAVIDSRGGVEIGSGTIIGPSLKVYTSNHNYKNPEFLPYDFTWIHKKVIIGKNVWIGGNVIILPGTIIRDGAIVAAGSVVRGLVDSCSIVSGNPAIRFGSRDEKVYAKLVEDNKIYQIEKKRR